MSWWLVDKYDVKAKAFIIKDKPPQITLNDVENIMGLPKQGHEFHPIGSERTSALFRELKDKNISGITYSSLLEQRQAAIRRVSSVLCFVYNRQHYAPLRAQP
jgi:hypothetical protein